jgi:pilus assembly protein CpaF
MAPRDRPPVQGTGIGVNDQLLARVLDHDELAELDAGERRLALRRLVAETTEAAHVSTTVAQLADTIDGFGPLAAPMRDDHVTDVLVNGPHEVWVEREGRLVRTDISWHDAEELHAFAERLLGDVGVRVDASVPIADARLSDGSRINVVLPPIAPGGPLLSIRRWPQLRYSLEDLSEKRMLEEGEADKLREAVHARQTIVIGGATGTGKTTLMNALLACIDSVERLVVIEETPELRAPGPQAVSLLARPDNIEGRGGIDLEALVRTSLRMRPDRIIVGEVRGPEALTALAAMSTGHEGSMVTLHAQSALDALDRMVTLALQAASGASEASLLRRVHAAFDLVVHLERRGERRVVADIRELS